jgi:dihydropteroate synthase
MVPIGSTLEANRHDRIPSLFQKPKRSGAWFRLSNDYRSNSGVGQGSPSIPTRLAQREPRLLLVILGHLRGCPATMMTNVHFDNLLAEVNVELGRQIQAARSVGCREVWADPCIGFGKLLSHNLQLLAGLPSLREGLGVPIMVGVSRKRFIGDLTGQPVHLRTYGTAAAVAVAVMGGVDAVRVHDVKEMRDVVRVAEAIASSRVGSEKHYNASYNG